MKNLESVAGVTSAEAMGADLAEAEVRMMEKPKNLVGEENDKVTLNGEINGKDDKVSNTEHLPDSTKNNKIEITEKNSEEEEAINDEEDKGSFVSLSQSTDFEVSPSSEVFVAKESEEPEDISKNSDITTEDLVNTSQGTEEVRTSQELEEPTDGNCTPQDRLSDDGSDGNEDGELEKESKSGKKEDVKTVDGEAVDQESKEDASIEENKEKEDGEKSTEEISSQIVDEKEGSSNFPSRSDELPEDKIDSEVKADSLKEESMNLVLTSDSEESKEASEEKKGEEKEKVEEASTVENQDDNDDAYGSDDESMDSLDINQGLQECFKNLEDKIAQEAEEENSRKRPAPSSTEGSTSDEANRSMEDINKDFLKSVDQELDVIKSAENSPDQTGSPRNGAAMKEDETEICLDKDVEKEKEKREGSEETDQRMKTAEEKMEEEIMTLDPDDDDELMAIDPDEEHESALRALEKIENSTRKIMDDEPTKRIHNTDGESEPATKKTRLNPSLEEEEEEQQLVDKKKLHKTLKRLSRSELEEIISNKMLEVMTNRSEIGRLRQKVDSYDETIKKWKSRAQALSKQCTDLGTVMKKYIVDSKNKPRERVAPVRITRSVGLQVMTAERKLQQQRQEQQAKLKLNAAGSRIATKPAQVRTPGNSVNNGAVRLAASSPAKNSVARPASGLVRLGVPIRHPSGIVAMPVSGTVRPSKPTSPMSAARKTGVTITPQTRVVNMHTPARSQPAVAGKPASKTVIDVVDLSDEEEPPQPPLVKITPVKAAPPPLRPGPRPGGLTGQQRGVMGSRPRAVIRGLAPLPSSHPAPLPLLPRQLVGQGMKGLPPKPSLKIQRAQNEKNGIILSWTLNHNPAIQAEITAYQLFAYQETSAKPDTSLWKKVGDNDVKAMPLPMACTLTQFTRGCKYHFAVRAVDCHKRLGMFSEPHSILLSSIDQ